jgi:4-carboxymuconolactone decarboxylase
MASDGDLLAAGLEMRRQVLGAEHVDRSMAGADDYMMAIQNLVTEWCWGYAWTRTEALAPRTRSLLNLVMLTALGKTSELKLHVRGAINNGVTVEEIREALLHATVYCGVPAGLEAFRASHEVLDGLGALPDRHTADAGPTSQPTRPNP